MAKRNNQRRVDSSAFQGEGSYVTVSSMTYGENREITLNPLEGEAKLRRNETNVIRHIHGWNWVDDDGSALPLPKDDPMVISRLTSDEWNFIVGAINGDPNVPSA